jgi:hypothetical protein
MWIDKQVSFLRTYGNKIVRQVFPKPFKATEIRAGPSRCIEASISSVLPSGNSSHRNNMYFFPTSLRGTGRRFVPEKTK